MNNNKMSSNLKHIPHNRPTIGHVEEMMALKVLKSGWLAQGCEVEKFENEFCDYLMIPRGSAVAVSSGSAALFLALLALKAKGKNVSLPTYSCSALRNAICLAGGNPVFVDSMLESPNIDLARIDHSTRIAIVPHMFGMPQNILNNKSAISVIEDCAQALGALNNKIPIGLQGDVGIFSFYATKLMTTGGQGGMVVSRKSPIIDYVRDYRLFDGRKDEKNRFNFQMTDIQAAIGRAQLIKLPMFLDRRSEIYNQYKEAGFQLLDSEVGLQPVRFRSIIRTEKQVELIKALSLENISATIPVQTDELLSSNIQFPNALYWTENTVSLPIYPSLTDEEVKRIIKVVKTVL
ncbi:DegT/DnrJ/EryC1/StrS family aminotransferase [Sporosarcina siberiensis]|uniref:DegT/DnrJ/EryC1/StrS family aminotransferase n=1 Tax=Sporosarcina siberiensis TaxID=1365606 RepID=A0ABW4SGC4_9BACL